MQEYIDLKVDFAKRNAQLSGMTLENVVVRSYDTAIKFRIEIADHVLDDTYDVKILSKYSCDKSQTLYKTGDNLEFLDGKLIYTPRVDLISQADYVRNYLYLSKDGLGLDMAQFNYMVDLSEIDKTALEVKLVYDQSYEALITEFEQALEDYKLTLPQADSVRAEIDVILNQFGVDSRAKLNQYDADAQQVIADNQTAFGLAETDRQNTYDQAEDNRNQASHQAVADWEQGADVLLETAEANESARLEAEATRKSNETDRESSESTRKTNETTRISNEQGRVSAESVRVANEAERELNEAERISKDSERDSKIEAVEGLQADFNNLDNVFHNTIQTNKFKVIACSVSELDNIREVHFKEQPYDNISYIAVIDSADMLAVWGAERKSSAVDGRYQLRMRRHTLNYFQTRNHEKDTGWSDWVNR